MYDIVNVDIPGKKLTFATLSRPPKQNAADDTTLYDETRLVV